MDRFDDDKLFTELREVRPTPRPEFAAELDQRAAAGFPRGDDTTASVFAPLVDWWSGVNPTRRLVPILGVALAVVVVATAAIGITQSVHPNSRFHDEKRTESGPAVSSSESAEAAGAEESAAAPAHVSGAKAPAAKANGKPAAGAAEGEEGAAELAEPPSETRENYIQAQQGLPDVEVVGGRAQRDIERSSRIVLGTKPGEVSSAAAKVYEAVHAADGFVLDSSVQSGTAGPTGASFELSIPTAKVNGALASISSIAEVRERHDATDDITAPTVSVAEELADSNATIEGLLKQLGESETEAQQDSVEARLREERHHHAAIRASLDHLHQRASMSQVSVRIVTNHGAGVTPPSKDDGSWGVGDALHDAGHILTIAAGVVLVGLAILAPFALIGLVFWAGNRFRVRRLRERTLG